jgi:transcriptional regulator with XRE-family HTH domain
METGRNGYLRRVANDTIAPNRIRELREALGISQKGLAEMAHVSPSALNKLEMGSRGLDLEWMRRLAPLLGVSPAELLPLSDNPDILNDEEREILTRYRAASSQDREKFDKVADVILPGSLERSKDAA